MARYCDSKELERFWFEWAMASSTPNFEPLRQVGAIYSRVKPDQIVTQKTQTCKNPWLPLKEHFLVLFDPVHVTSEAGDVNFDLERIQVRVADRVTHQRLLDDGYYLEPTESYAWERLFLEVKKMCEGISRKFSVEPDSRMEIEQEGLVMIIDKIRNKKIRYEPGLAPVFNFLTTAIHRCIYNHLRKSTRYSKQMHELRERMDKGHLDVSMRSYKPISGV